MLHLHPELSSYFLKNQVLKLVDSLSSIPQKRIDDGRVPMEGDAPVTDAMSSVGAFFLYLKMEEYAWVLLGCVLANDCMIVCFLWNR